MALAGATVTVSSANQTLLTATTDELGQFQFSNFEPPADFVVTAVTPGGQTFSAVVRNHPGGGRYVVLNVPTTLVGELGGTDEAQARVAAFLGVRDPRALEYGLLESGGDLFSHLDFFVQAAGAGGWDAYRNRIVGELRGSGTHFFRANLNDLTASLAGLDGSLATPLNQFRSNQATRRALLAALARRRPDLLGLALDGGRPRVGASVSPKGVAGFVGGRLLDTLLDQTVDVAWTHIADALSLNYGTTTILLDIQATVDASYELLVGLALGDTKDDLQSAITAMNDSVNLTIANFKLLTSASTPVSTNLATPEVPINPSGSVNALTGKLITFKDDLNLTLIQEYMLGLNGNINFLITNRNYLLNELRGMSMARSSVGYFPLRSQGLLDDVFSPLNYYAGIQQAACYTIAEASHLTTPANPDDVSVNPTSNMLNAQTTLTEAADKLRQQRAQYPQGTVVPAGVIVDLDFGLMWRDTVQPAKSLTNAISAADSWTLSFVDENYSVYYDDWRLPTPEEMRSLQDRGRLVYSQLRDSNVQHNGSDDSEGVTGYASTGLTQLGFKNVSILNSNGDVLILDYIPNDSLFGPVTGYTLYGTGSLQGNPEYRLNVGTNHINTTDTRPFFMVRSIGKPVVPIDDDGNIPVDEGPAVPFTYTNPSNDEIRMLGELVSVGQIKLLPPVGSSNNLADQVFAQVGLAMNVGGSFNMGPNNETGRSYPTRTFSSNYETYASTDGGTTYSELTSLARYVSFSTMNTDVNLRPSGKLFWKAGGNGGFNLSALASAYKVDGNVVSSTSNETVPVSDSRHLTRLQIFPRNKIYQVRSSNATDRYYCLAFYSDNTIEDVSTKVTFTAAANATTDNLVNTSFSTAANNEGLLTVGRGTSTYVKLTAVLNSDLSKSDTTVAEAASH